MLLNKLISNGPNVIVQAVRTSEARLNRAEAYLQLNKLGDALNDLNDLRRRRIIGYADVSISDKARAAHRDPQRAPEGVLL